MTCLESCVIFQCELSFMIVCVEMSLVWFVLGPARGAQPLGKVCRNNFSELSGARQCARIVDESSTQDTDKR